MADGEFRTTFLTQDEIEEMVWYGEQTKKAERIFKNLKRLQAWFRRFEFLGRGRHKLTYAHPSGLLVMKIPCKPEGIFGIETEYLLYTRQKHKRNRRVADCHMRYVGGVPVLYMERVRVMADAGAHGFYMSEEDDARAEAWVHDVDCSQVGMTWDGRIVAFDYGFCSLESVDKCRFVRDDLDEVSEDEQEEEAA